MNGRFRKLSCKSCLAAIYRERYKDSRMIAKERAGNVAFNAFMSAWIPRGMNT